MQLQVLSDPEAVAEQGAEIIVAEAGKAVAARGKFTLAVSGGETPGKMFRRLAAKHLPWESVHIFQVDERAVPESDERRNLSHVPERLRQRIHSMPVEQEDLEVGAAAYAATLERIAGFPPVLDLVHLGLGVDGHTASLVPGDPVLAATGRDVAVTGIYQGTRRMTLTYPALCRARRILWLVTGVEKADMIARLMRADPTIPAGRLRQQRASERDLGDHSLIITH